MCIERLREDFQKDRKIFASRDKEFRAMSDFFFERFCSNQTDWTEDHDYIFKYSTSLQEEYQEIDAAAVASSIRVLEATNYGGNEAGLDGASRLSASYPCISQPDADGQEDNDYMKSGVGRVRKAQQVIEHLLSMPNSLVSPWLVHWFTCEP